VEFLNEIIGKDIKPAYLAVRAGDVFKTLADVGKIKKILGFDPKVDFLQGLKLTVEYFKHA
jgi:nucleoside-diphosphate-sugar epimerase